VESLSVDADTGNAVEEQDPDFGSATKQNL
jgi:hypothetical protein